MKIAGSSKVRRNLVCRRRLTLLLRETRHVSGHLATLTVYEEVQLSQMHLLPVSQYHVLVGEG